MNRNSLFWLPIVIVLVLSGCAKPPESEIERAKSTLGQAESEGAAQYAPDAWNRAKQAMENLDKELRDQDGKFALIRRYQRAESLAAEAVRLAESARSQVVQTKAGIRDDVATAIADAARLLESARSRLAAIGRASGLNAAALGARLDTAAQRINRARSELDAEGFANAATTVEEARRLIQEVLSTIEQAVQPPSKKR